MDKYIYQLGLMHIYTNVDEYILHFGSQVFAIWTNTLYNFDIISIFTNLDKYDLGFGWLAMAEGLPDLKGLQFEQIHLSI